MLFKKQEMTFFDRSGQQEDTVMLQIKSELEIIPIQFVVYVLCQNFFQHYYSVDQLNKR